MWIRVAAKCGSATRVETLAADSAVDPMQWVDERVDALCSAGARGALYVFIRHPPDAALGDALRRVTTGRRLQPNVVATGAALTSGTHLELLQYAGVYALYVTLHGATAAAHEARAGESGGWRRVLILLTTAPRLIQRVHVGAHLLLSRDTVDELPGVLRLVRKVGSGELLLWDAGSGGMDVTGLAPVAALRALDFAATAAQKLGVRLLPVGFERTRTAVAPIAPHACVASGAIIELLRDDIPLPSAGAGLLASDGKSASIAAAAPTGRAVSQLAFELAAGGRPFLDLPACLGGPPPDGSARPNGVKVDACRQCPIDLRCSGVPATMIDIPGLREEIQPPRHWTAMPAGTRALVLCAVTSEALYGATFFSLARWLARLGAHVDVVTPWAIHADIAPSFAEVQPTGRPSGPSEVEKFISEGPVERYDLIVTPDPKITHPLVVSRRLRHGTRLAVTDFHMLGGMDWWARDLRAPGRRPEEGGWWPSDHVMLYSGFPGYARLYTRYGVPMRQVAWQPYALDPAYFPVEEPATDGTSIISAGHHRRDLDTLLAAAARLGADVHPIDLLSPDRPPQAPRKIRSHGTLPTSVFCSMVGRSRFMIVPLLEDPHNASGITAMVTAIMYGRPIVATATAASRDHITDGVNGLLVPADDPQAMAEAIERLDTDPALLAALAAGARQAAGKFTTEAWARALLHGSRTYETEHWMWTKWRSQPRLT